MLSNVGQSAEHPHEYDSGPIIAQVVLLPSHILEMLL